MEVVESLGGAVNDAPGVEGERDGAWALVEAEPDADADAETDMLDEEGQKVWAG